MSLIADGLLIATCLTAAIYCYVLARRLKQFASTEKGIGQQILQLSATLEETRSALKEAQAGAKTDAAALERNIAEARKLATQLRNLTEQGAAVAAAVNTPIDDPAARSRPGVQASVATTGGLMAAAAVEVQETPDAAPPEEIEAKDIEAEEIDLAEINVADLLAASTGEQQLGFLPDDSEEDGDEPESAEISSGSERTEDHAPGASDGNSFDEGSVQAPLGGSGNLLKVERMAL